MRTAGTMGILPRAATLNSRDPLGGNSAVADDDGLAPSSTPARAVLTGQKRHSFVRVRNISGVVSNTIFNMFSKGLPDFLLFVFDSQTCPQGSVFRNVFLFFVPGCIFEKCALM